MTDEEREAIKRLKYKEYCLRMLPYQKKKNLNKALLIIIEMLKKFQ